MKDQDGVKSLDLTSEFCLPAAGTEENATIFSVVNYEGSAISETAMEYTISLRQQEPAFNVFLTGRFKWT